MVLVLAAAAAVLAGAVVRGYTGFGASMFWVARLSLIYPPAGVVPTVLALEVLASLTLLPSVTHEVHWRSMRWMLAATVLTMPIGVALLSVLPARPMRLVVAASILLGTLALASGLQIPGRPGFRTALTAGSVSGIVNGSTGVGGPPAVLLYFSDSNAQEVGRATLIAYFLGTARGSGAGRACPSACAAVRSGSRPSAAPCSRPACGGWNAIRSSASASEGSGRAKPPSPPKRGANPLPAARYVCRYSLRRWISAGWRVSSPCSSTVVSRVRPRHST